MGDYIDINEAIIDFGFQWDDIVPTRDEFINFLKSRKRANVKEIVYAHWICKPDCGVTECSNCHRSVEEYIEYPRCMYCGAEMNEVTE